jgi:hypothetical protein
VRAQIDLSAATRQDGRRPCRTSGSLARG